MTMPAGKYYVGDLCYVMDDDEWKEVCSRIRGRGVWGECLDGEFVLHDGRKLAIYSTKWGDGTYYDELGHSYSVDSGGIGCIRVEDIKANKYDNLLDLGAILEFDEPFVTSEHTGLIQFGYVIIETNPTYEDEEL
jgi:hypothetical protein